MTIGLITARGGSTRIPRKNVQNYCGLPLVAWSVIQSVNTKKIDMTFLTTDDDEIAEIGAKYGATIIRRPVWDNGITAGVPMLHALKEIEKQSYIIDNIVTMLPTAALKKVDDLDRLIEVFNKLPTYVDNITTMCPQKETFIFRNTTPYYDRFKTNPIHEYYEMSPEIGDKFWNYSRMGGGWGIATRDFLYNAWSTNPTTDLEIDTKPVDKNVKITAIPIEEWQLVDIDYPEDLELSQVLFEHYVLKGHGPEIYEEYKKDIIE